VLADVPVGLPGLTRAVKLQKRMAKIGFDWPDLAPVLAKVDEELDELKSAIAEKNAIDAREHVAEELGDLLFVLANVARHLDVDPEAALRTANAKVVRRFEAIEAALAAQGRNPNDATLEEMDALWDAAKSDEKRADEKKG
jgi:MazG family protein